MKNTDILDKCKQEFMQKFQELGLKRKSILSSFSNKIKEKEIENLRNKIQES